MSKTAASTLGEVIVTVASHLSNVPFIATDAFTLNLIELSSVVILMTGTSAEACARVIDGDRAEARMQRIATRIRQSVSPSRSRWELSKIPVLQLRIRIAKRTSRHLYLEP